MAYKHLVLVIVLGLAALLVLNQEKHKPPGIPTVAPAPANRVVVAQEYDIITLDPSRATDTGSLRVIANIYEGLVRFKPGTASVEPCLARSWEVNEDGTIWTFNLRQDVYFHDGTPLDAKTVVDSVNRQVESGRNGVTTYADFVYGPVEKVVARDRYTVQFNLKYPYSPFLNNLASPMAAPVTKPPAGKGDESSLPPLGTGPFIPASVSNGRVLLRANPEYWGDTPKVEEVFFMTIKNAGERAKMLLEGKIDIALDLSFDKAADLRSRGYPVFQVTGLDFCYLGFYSNRKPFDQPKLRRAVVKAINREEIVREIGIQKVRQAQTYLPPAIHDYSNGVSLPAHDLTASRKLLAEAGYKDGFSFTLVTYTDPRPYSPGGGTEIAEAVARSAAKAGINVNIRAYPWDRFKQALREQEGDAFLYGWISDNGDPDNFLYTLLVSGQPGKSQNITRYRSTELETLLVSGRITPDKTIRSETYNRVFEILNRDTPLVVLCHSLHHAASSPSVVGFALNPTGWHVLNKVQKVK